MKRILVFLMTVVALAAHAAGPRWVAGSQWTNAGQAMNWYRSDVRYYVDPGPLSASVDNAAGVSMIDAAAAVWNVSGLPFTLTNGGALAEDVNADNVYLGQGGLVWPADVASSNYMAKQIAVVLDADGSVTDALLGSGASAPLNCRTNGVTESVDLFIQPGRIAHAVVVVNGRCSGPAKEQQLQLQYQLMRVFGRVIGIGWSQLNDNVFTGTPLATPAQQMHWPIMHPIDILCGPYTYQCLPQPFVLREDDISAMWQIYADSSSSLAAANMVKVSGTVNFSSKAAMAGVNVVARRFDYWNTEPYQDVSAVSGFAMAGARGNPVNGAISNALGTAGFDTASPNSAWVMGAISIATGKWLVVTTEPINPLYVGAYAVGPYRMGSPAPSGSALNGTYGWFFSGQQPNITLTVADATSDCTTGADGAENLPADLPVDGLWTGRLCGVGHTSWFTMPVKAGRTATVEAVATDETGGVSVSKAMPLLGAWHGSDAPGTLPGIAAAKSAFNTSRTGMTQMRASFATAETVRLAVTDARGDGRPDYTYRLRVLYADAVSPSRLASAGGTVVITGTGFAPGNTVTVGGVVARVLSQTSTRLEVAAPSRAAVRSAGAKDVVVTDLSTGGTTTITGGILYGGAATDRLRITSAPASSVPVGSSAALTVQLTDASGTPVRNGEVTLSATSGSIVLAACNMPICTLVTDSAGIASTGVTPAVSGSTVLEALSASGAAAQVAFTATDVSRVVALRRPTQYVASGAGALFQPAVTVLANGSASAGQEVSWTASSTRTALSATASTSDSSGSSAIGATGSLRDGEAATVQACAWTSVCASANLIGVPAANLLAATVSGDVQSLTASDTLGTVALRVVDNAGHPVAGAAVGVYQAVSGWQPPCTGNGRCAAAPVYGKSAATVMSDDDGLIQVTPLQYANTAAVTRITATVGTASAVTVTLEKTP